MKEEHDESRQPRPNPLNTFGKRLRAARLAVFERTGKELTQAQLSKSADVTKGTISAYENDAYLPTIETLEKLARAVGVLPCWLAFGQEPRYPPEIPKAAKRKR